MFIRRIDFIQAILVSAIALAVPNIALADGGAAAAKKMAEVAADFSAKAGAQKLIERVNAKDPEFYQGELYVVVCHSTVHTSPTLQTLNSSGNPCWMFRTLTAKCSAKNALNWLHQRVWAG